MMCGEAVVASAMTGVGQETQRAQAGTAVDLLMLMMSAVPLNVSYSKLLQGDRERWYTDALGAGHENSSLLKKRDGLKKKGDLENFIDDCGTKKDPIDTFSTALVTHLMSLVSKRLGSDASEYMNVVNSLFSTVQSTGQEQESPGQNLAKTEDSVVQQDSSAQQNISEMGQNVLPNPPHPPYGSLAASVKVISFGWVPINRRSHPTGAGFVRRNFKRCKDD
jgi:hypothetical protein